MWQNNSIGLEPISTEVSPFGTVTEKSKQILDLQYMRDKSVVQL